MAELAGIALPSLNVNLTGVLSGSWIYVLIIAFIGLILLATLAVVLFFQTYSRKVIVFENISGQGYQPVLKTRARLIRLGTGGDEVLKTLAGGKYVSAYGRKMGKNSYWFAKAGDGYWYNIVVGDLDAKMATLDIEPVDRDVRMFHVALDRLSHFNYGKKENFFEKYAFHMLAFVFLVVFILGMWIIIGKIGDATAPLANANENQLKVTELNLQISERLDSIARRLNIEEPTDPGSGLVSAPE